MRRLALLAIVAGVLAGCSEKRYVCSACLRDDDGTCATSTALPDRDEARARCAAASDLCGQLTEKDIARVCRPYRHDPTFGCDKQVLEAMTFTCTTSTALRVPLLIDL